MSSLPTIRYPGPPAHIARYCDAIGAEKCIDLLLAFGGADLEISLKPRPGSQLVEAVGMEAALKLAQVRGRLPRRVPLGAPWLARCLKARGHSNAEIARRLRITDITVRHYLNTDRSDYGEML